MAIWAVSQVRADGFSISPRHSVRSARIEQLHAGRLPCAATGGARPPRSGHCGLFTVPRQGVYAHPWCGSGPLTRSPPGKAPVGGVPCSATVPPIPSLFSRPSRRHPLRRTRPAPAVEPMHFRRRKCSWAMGGNRTVQRLELRPRLLHVSAPYHRRGFGQRTQFAGVTTPCRHPPFDRHRASPADWAFHVPATCHRGRRWPATACREAMASWSRYDDLVLVGTWARK
jgi:hypothetical protein